MALSGLAHQVYQDLLRVRAEIGRLPSRDEYQKLGKYPKSVIVETFGSWTQFIQASGLQYSTKGKRDNQEIRLEAYNHLQKEVAARKKEAREKRVTHRLLCISDMHHPYGHPDILPFLKALQDKYRFDRVLCGGDEVDFHALSFHDSDPDLLSAGHELEAAIKALEPIYALFPNVDVLSSNHGDLAYRKGKHHGIPRHVLKGYQEVLRAPSGWKWRESFTYEFPSGQKAIAMHGMQKNILMAAKKLGACFIQFHFHNDLSLQYWAMPEALLWALQCGCLIDDTSLAYAYNKAILERPVIGCAGVIDGIPVLFPMMLDSSGRWNGVVP
jgi:hypothetical protein